MASIRLTVEIKFGNRSQEQRILCFKYNNTILSEFNIKIETEKCTIFLISMGRLLSHEESFVRWLSITKMMAMQTWERVAICA